MLACMPACIAGHMSVVMYVYVDGTLLALEGVGAEPSTSPRGERGPRRLCFVDERLAVKGVVQCILPAPAWWMPKL